MGSLIDELARLQSYTAGVATNARYADAADEILRRCAEYGHGSVDISWVKDCGASLVIFGDLTKEADIRRIFHEVADERGIQLVSPKRTDSLKEMGYVMLDYGKLSLRIAADGQKCRRVQVGTRRVEAHDEPVYAIKCGEPEEAPAVEPSAELQEARP